MSESHHLRPVDVSGAFAGTLTDAELVARIIELWELKEHEVIHQIMSMTDRNQLNRVRPSLREYLELI